MAEITPAPRMVTIEVPEEWVKFRADRPWSGDIDELSNAVSDACVAALDEREAEQ